MGASGPEPLFLRAIPGDGVKIHSIIKLMLFIFFLTKILFYETLQSDNRGLLLGTVPDGFIDALINTWRKFYVFYF